MINPKTGDVSELQIFKTVVSYCFGIIILPVATFFVVKNLIFDVLLDTIPANVYSAISAVVVLHIALGIFIYRAYKEVTPPKPIQKRD